MARTKRSKLGKGSTTSRHPHPPAHPSNNSATSRRRKVHIKDGISIRKSVQTLKYDIRGVERLLSKLGDQAEATQIARLEKKLTLLRAELEYTTSMNADKVNKYDTMYRSVRFIERRKAMRKIHQLQQQLVKARKESAPHEDHNKEESVKVRTEELEIKLQHAKFDLVYIMHYPAGTKYVAMWPTTTDDNETIHHSKPSEIMNNLDNEAVTTRARVRAHLQQLIDHGIINTQATVEACMGEEDEDKEMKKKVKTKTKTKTKTKGPNEEQIKHRTIGNLIRGVGVDILSEEEEEDDMDGIKFEEAVVTEEEEEEAEEETKVPVMKNMNADDFFMS